MRKFTVKTYRSSLCKPEKSKYSHPVFYSWPYFFFYWIEMFTCKMLAVRLGPKWVHIPQKEYKKLLASHDTLVYFRELIRLFKQCTYLFTSVWNSIFLRSSSLLSEYFTLYVTESSVGLRRAIHFYCAKWFNSFRRKNSHLSCHKFHYF